MYLPASINVKLPAQTDANDEEPVNSAIHDQLDKQIKTVTRTEHIYTLITVIDQGRMRSSMQIQLE